MMTISGVKNKLTKIWYYLNMKKYNWSMDLYDRIIVVISVLRYYDEPIDIVLLKTQTEIPLDLLIYTLDIMCEFELLTTEETDQNNIQLVETYKQKINEIL